MNSNRIISLLLLIALGLPGCASVPHNEAPPAQRQSLTTTIKVAAYIGTAEALRSHPEWIEEFQRARAELAALEALPQIDFAELLAIVHRLPVRELKSERAILIITAATILLDEIGSNPVALDTQQIAPIVRALREGIELGTRGSATLPMQ